MDDTSRGWGLLLGHPRGPHVATSGDFATAMDSVRSGSLWEAGHVGLPPAAVTVSAIEGLGFVGR